MNLRPEKAGFSRKEAINVHLQYKYIGFPDITQQVGIGTAGELDKMVGDTVFQFKFVYACPDQRLPLLYQAAQCPLVA